MSRTTAAAVTALAVLASGCSGANSPSASSAVPAGPLDQSTCLDISFTKDNLIDIQYDLGQGHPLLGRRMPDLDVVTTDGPVRVFELLHDARPVLLDLAGLGGLVLAPWSDRVRYLAARYAGGWELPALGAVPSPGAVLIRPDGYVAWAGERAEAGLRDALSRWFGPPSSG